jgi:hypothetical protein
VLHRPVEMTRIIGIWLLGLADDASLSGTGSNNCNLLFRPFCFGRPEVEWRPLQGKRLLFGRDTRNLRCDGFRINCLYSAALIITGVPTLTILLNSSASQFVSRMQPCDSETPILAGFGVP